MSELLTEDTKAIALLCGVFGDDRSNKPLSVGEYATLVHWLIAEQMRPADLLYENNIVRASSDLIIDKQRLQALLNRGAQLGLAIEKWYRCGIWVVSRSDSDYPDRYKKRLKESAPPLLFGTGDRAMLIGGGLGIVGSRNVDKAGEACACEVAEVCADNHIPVVSGGARGVDQIAMRAAIDAGGTSIGIIADNLLRKSVERGVRGALADGRLLLLSPYHPNAPFSVGAAMGRNKLIYAMSDFGLIVSSESEKGGTWHGARDQLKKPDNPLPIFIRTGNDAPQGNHKLLEEFRETAIPWPSAIERDGFMRKLEEIAVDFKKSVMKNLNVMLQQQITHGHALIDKQSETAKQVGEYTDVPEVEAGRVKDADAIFFAVLPVILPKLIKSAELEKLAKILNVTINELDKWLTRAENENMVTKSPKTKCYHLSVFGQQVISRKKLEAAGLDHIYPKNTETHDEFIEDADSIYRAVLPVILKKLSTPSKSTDLAAELNVGKGQFDTWIRRAEDDKMVARSTYLIAFKFQNQ